MKNIMDAILIAVCGFVIILEFLRILKAMFNPALLKHHAFDFPINKGRLILLSLCAIGVMLIAILRKLE